MDFIDRLMAYEAGELNDDELIAFFQELIDSGTVWQLQGHYGRTARQLIESGYCTDPNESASSDEGAKDEY